MKRWALILSVIALWGSMAAAESLKVGLHLPDRRPYFWVNEEKANQGIYIDLLQQIGKMIGVEMEFVYVPQARLIKEFNDGLIDLEPGIAPSWRPSEEDQKLSLYSLPFIELQDVLIFQPGKAVTGINSMDDLGKLNSLIVGQVRGFYVPPGLTVSEARDEQQIARMVDKGNLDAGFMNALVAAYYQKTLGLKYELSPPFATTPVSMRLRRNQEKWLAPMNAAIQKLQADGTLQGIIAKYIN